MTPALLSQPCPPPYKLGRHTEESDAATTRFALAARDGNPIALEQLIRALHSDVWRFVAYLSADSQLADDLAQDTFVRALRSPPRFEGRSSARTWLLSIARHTVIDNFRHNAARPAISDREDWQTLAEKAQPCALPGFDEGIALAELLTALPCHQRQAFVLTQLLGLPYAEAARMLGCPIGTVRSRIARARTTLTDLLAEAERPTRIPSRERPGGRHPAPLPDPAATAVPAA